MTEEWRTIAVLVVLGLLLVVTLGALVLIVRSLRDLAGDMRRLSLQQATVVRMLLRAGFRPPSSTADWLEDADKTRARGETWWTQWDLRRPQ